MNSYANLNKTRYMFVKNNIELDVIKLIEDIGVTKFAYLNILMQSIDTKNRIHFDNIHLSDSNIRSLVSLFKKKWFIQKIKLKWDSVKTFYLNPLYAHRGQTLTTGLFEAFDDVNNGKVY